MDTFANESATATESHRQLGDEEVLSGPCYVQWRCACSAWWREQETVSDRRCGHCSGRQTAAGFCLLLGGAGLHSRVFRQRLRRVDPTGWPPLSGGQQGEDLLEKVRYFLLLFPSFAFLLCFPPLLPSVSPYFAAFPSVRQFK